jgi:NADPH-dependent curcumin reductase CurA
MTYQSQDFLVSRKDLRQAEWRTQPVRALNDGDILVKIDHFAFTANNITYGVFGQAMGYWNFFPAPEGLGRIPVWGFGNVVQSRHPDVSVGERLYGYFPMSEYLVIEADRITPSALSDRAAHRAAMAAVYNHYQRVSHDPGHSAAIEPAQAILRPLFMTSFVIDDFLEDNGFFGAKQVILSSASSKTSLGLAFALKQAARKGIEVVGLTSAANKAFVESVGYYHKVVTYDAIQSLRKDTAVFVDMAGGGSVRAAIHNHFAETLAYSCAVGGTHWEDRAVPEALPGPSPTLFFAPAQIKKRHSDWGPGELDKRVASIWSAFLSDVARWLKVTEGAGPKAVETIYHEVLEGRAKPEQGHMARIGA